jgi:hypothetical protein
MCAPTSWQFKLCLDFFSKFTNSSVSTPPPPPSYNPYKLRCILIFFHTTRISFAIIAPFERDSRNEPHLYTCLKNMLHHRVAKKACGFNIILSAKTNSIQANDTEQSIASQARRPSRASSSSQLRDTRGVASGWHVAKTEIDPVVPVLRKDGQVRTCTGETLRIERDAAL